VWAANKPLTGLCGTPDYVAPEVLTWYEDDDNGKPYGKGSDLWSLGVLLYVILSGCSPFTADDEEQLLKQVAEAKYEFHENEWRTVSDHAKDLIRRLLVVDPLQRMSKEQLLVHPWLKDAVDKCRADVEAKMKSYVPHPTSGDSKPAAAATNGDVAPQSSQPVVQTEGAHKETTTCSSCSLL